MGHKKSPTSTVGLYGVVLRRRRQYITIISFLVTRAAFSSEKGKKDLREYDNVNIIMYYKIN
jgi:hypothetical protein